MVALREAVRRWTLAVLARRGGEVRAHQDLRHLEKVGRLASVFAITMILPIAFLAFLALSSIRSEELSLDADLRARGRSTVTQLQREVEAIFARFEGAVLERLARGEVPTTNLGELSPHLRAAFRFDPEGELAGPFQLPTQAAPVDPSAGWQRAVRAARAREASDPTSAREAWATARASTREPALVGEAILGEARALAAAGRLPEAHAVLAELYPEYADRRDARGFRLGDLSLLERTRWLIARGDTEAANSALQELVDDRLDDPWVIGEAADPAVVREALRRLEGLAPTEWLAGRRARLNDRQAQLDWADLVQDEIEVVYSRLPSPEDFRYLGARNDSPAVWAIVRAQDGTYYAFSFSAQALAEELRGRVEQLDALESELVARVYLGEDVPDTAFAARGLGPWLPTVTLSVEPKDPEGLARSKNRRRSVRIAIVVTAVFVSVVGALWVARMIAGEVENARQRADFAANVSHELRSPITQIRLKGEALQLGLVEAGDDMQQHFDGIVRESERLSRLVDNVLDFAAIERGAKSYQLRLEPLDAAIVSSVEAARPTLEQLGMEVHLELPDDVPRLWIDRDAVGQVLTNLLSNAAKYGAEGAWVRVRVRPVADGVELSVADRGIGISEAELPRVFDDFFRSADPKVRRTKGTGIGLAIVRYIVEAHGGTIGVESTPGRGSTFTIVLPLVPPDGVGERA